MVGLNCKAKELLKERGCTQAWVIDKMNSIDPSIKMDRSKFSAFINSKRQISGKELLVFCMALKISPDVFLDQKTH